MEVAGGPRYLVMAAGSTAISARHAGKMECQEGWHPETIGVGKLKSHRKRQTMKKKNQVKEVLEIVTSTVLLVGVIGSFWLLIIILSDIID